MVHEQEKAGKDEKRPVMRLHLWLESDGGVLFGQGRAQLLEYINEFGSLKKAAEKMGMSYRGAWGKIKRTEEILGLKLIEKLSNKEGYALTDAGREFKKSFLQLLDDVEAFALKRAEELFPWKCRQYESLADDAKPE